MTEENKGTEKTSCTVKKRSIVRRIVKSVVVLIAVGALAFAVALFYNNVSLTTDKGFAKELDASLSQAQKWIEQHTDDILNKKNAALLTMLRECDDVKPTPIFNSIVHTFLDTPISHHTVCWKREVDPSWPVNEHGLSETIEKENIDEKWCLYAIAPDIAKITPDQMDLFNPHRWQFRQLTHQLWALVILRQNTEKKEGLDKLIEHLCGRLNGELLFDMALTDIYIQKVAFVLRAGFPDKIRRRWVERIIANQRSDGGWNDRWLCFSSGRRPVFDTPPSDQHATVQALMALYLVKYRYPEHFGLKQMKVEK